MEDGASWLQALRKERMPSQMNFSWPGRACQDPRPRHRYSPKPRPLSQPWTPRSTTSIHSFVHSVSFESKQGPFHCIALSIMSTGTRVSSYVKVPTISIDPTPTTPRTPAGPTLDQTTYMASTARPTPLPGQASLGRVSLHHSSRPCSDPSSPTTSAHHSQQQPHPTEPSTESAHGGQTSVQVMSPNPFQHIERHSPSCCKYLPWHPNPSCSRKTATYHR